MMRGESEKDNFIVIDKFTVGWQKRLDASSLPLGGARNSTNITLTDRGGIAPRGGELLLGTANDIDGGVKSIWSFKKADGTEILIKSYDDRLDYLSPKYNDWALIKEGYTDSQVFGFREHNINPQGVDTLCFGNGIDNFSQWCGYDALLTQALSGGETEVLVDTVLTETVHYTGTASASTTTTVTASGNIWANDIWNDFYVRITSGSKTGFIARIIATTPNSITFTPAITGLTGAVTFQIRQLAVPNIRRVAGTGIAFVAATDTITDTTGEFITQGFKVNDTITVSGSASNNGTYTITNVAQGVISVAEALVNESAGASVVIVTTTAGTIVYNDTAVAYTGVPRDDRFTVASAHASATGLPLTIGPIEYANDPKGNIFETLNGQLYVSGDIAKPMTVYRSSLNSSEDFNQSVPRSADEGDIQWFPYGGRRISDVRAQEDSLYVISSDSVTDYSYTQDENDVAIKTPIIQGPYVGTYGRTWKMDNDFAYVTPDNRITTIGRVLRKDFRPQAMDIAYPIDRAMQQYNSDAVVGNEFRNRAFVGIKQDYDVVANDRVLVYNKDYAAWEGAWTVNAGSLASYDTSIVYGDSYTPNVFKLMTGINKVKDGVSFPISCEWQSGFINLRGSGFYLEEVSCLAVEGYITSGTTININLYKDFAIAPFWSGVILGSETQYQDNLPQFTVLGGDPLGTTPLGAASILGDPEDDGRRHFIIFLDFIQAQMEYLSVGVGSSGLNQNWEVIRLGINARENVFENQNRIKN